jgi:hypothetical protein
MESKSSSYAYFLAVAYLFKNGGWPIADKYIIFFGDYKDDIKLFSESRLRFS